MALAGVAASPAALATPVRVDFSGVIEEIGGYRHEPGQVPTSLTPEEAEALLGGSIHVGTAFSGYLVYDDATPNSDGYPESDAGAPAWALYFFVDPSSAAHGEIGAFGGTTSGANAMEISDNEVYLGGASPSSLYLAGGFAAAPTEDQMTLLQVILWAAGGAPGAPLHGTSLANIPWDLASFPNTHADWQFSDGLNTITARGAVTQLVPEPAAATLLALAACALLAARSR